MANVLIIKLGALGDIVMSTSLIKQIQSFHSTDKLFLLTSKPFHTIFHSWTDLNVQTIERKGFLNTIRTIMWIRENHFAAVYDLQSNDRTGLYCAVSGISRRIGNHPRYPYNVHPEDTYRGQCHIYDRMLTVLESAGIPAEPLPPALPASNEEKQKISSWIRENELIVNDFIIIHAGGSRQHLEKRWPYYEQLAKIFSAENKSIVWVGGNDDLEINKILSSITGINASKQFTFPELAELGRHASFALTNDSGPMHILSCSDIPVYAFFGPSNWKRNHAVGQKEFVITRGLSVGGQNKNYQDLGQIKVDDVVSILKKSSLL